MIIKAAGNLGYPMGLYLERLSAELVPLAREKGMPLEELIGAGADPRTMIGIGARKRLPVLVTIPQLVGGGSVGLAIGDSLSITERAERIAAMLGGADVIIESAVALTQEVHDGPYETHTGHGLWAAWQGRPTFSLQGKTLVRIDLDPALEQVWQAERQSSAVQEAIDKGLPKTKLFKRAVPDGDPASPDWRGSSRWWETSVSSGRSWLCASLSGSVSRSGSCPRSITVC